MTLPFHTTSFSHYLPPCPSQPPKKYQQTNQYHRRRRQHLIKTPRSPSRTRNPTRPHLPSRRQRRNRKPLCSDRGGECCSRHLSHHRRFTPHHHTKMKHDTNKGRHCRRNSHIHLTLGKIFESMPEVLATTSDGVQGRYAHKTQVTRLPFFGSKIFLPSVSP